jgi:hypothetical protein
MNGGIETSQFPPAIAVSTKSMSASLPQLQSFQSWIHALIEYGRSHERITASGLKDQLVGIG